MYKTYDKMPYDKLFVNFDNFYKKLTKEND